MAGQASANQFMTLLRVSSGIDVVGEVTVTVAEPADLTAWSAILDCAQLSVWRCQDSGQCFAEVTALSGRSPVHGRVCVVLDCARHPQFWSALLGGREIGPGQRVGLETARVAEAWLETSTGPLFGT